MSGETLTFQTTLVSHECPTCGVMHAYPDALNRKMLENRGPRGRVCYCPNGHEWWYTGKSDAEKARDERDRYKSWLREEEASRRREQKAHAATKGQLTRARKRALAGVCPCCHRTFANVQRHMASKHPDELRATT